VDADRDYRSTVSPTNTSSWSVSVTVSARVRRFFVSLAVVRDQGIERVVVAAFVLAPEPDGTSRPEVRAVALDPDFLLDRLQPSRESDPLQGYMRSRWGVSISMSKAVSRKGTSNRAPLNVASRLASANCSRSRPR